ncbi:hypothetical protein [Pleionea sp. CnH1-48]|uniref:hypothetical protein n=1 Tax=Pleionea sp. CnH1-48 TaxID=2954494 RepID=UPI0020982FF1|nr:hypothetical protein [Pleionea sp. CnH1-48]MCO7226554.1 hypothetical protein [Pleionea sp. CnH1-48]
MAKRNRSTLKSFFQKGALPSSDQFSDLIDSQLNIVDEGFNKSPENGLEISSLGDNDNLVSFYKINNVQYPNWSIGFDGQSNDQLSFRQHSGSEQQSAVISLSPEGRVGINTNSPESELDVNGVIKSKGRRGIETKSALADGQWHDISDGLNGCQAFEVIAGAGNKGTGKYALMHAIAMNTFNPKGWLFNFLGHKNKVKYHHAYYYSFAHRLKLRWRKDKQSDQYYLQIRSNCDYGEGIRIRYSITKLWFDEDMSGSWMNEQDNGSAS